MLHNNGCFLPARRRASQKQRSRQEWEQKRSAAACWGQEESPLGGEIVRLTLLADESSFLAAPKL